MDSPKFSIIIPNYNHDAFLEKAILSVVDQEYKNKELIVIDGGSTDHSIEIIKKYEKEIAYWVSEKDKGTYDANNKGLKKVTGDFWCVLNSDDVLMPDALTILSEVVRDNPNEKWIAGTVNVIDENDLVIGELRPHAPSPIEGYTFLDSCWISHPATFLHKDILSEVGFFERWNLMDYHYWLRMEKSKFFPYSLDKKIAALRMHRNCKSYDKVSFYREMRNVVVGFCTEQKMIDKPRVKEKVKEYTSIIFRISIGRDLVNNRKLPALNKILKFSFYDPSILSKRLFWGYLLRVITGLDSNDPLLRIRKDGGSATWDYKD